MRFHFCFCFFDWYSYRSYEFCNWIKTCVITAGVKKYKSIIKKKKKKLYKIVSLANSKLNRKEILICQSSVDSNISHDEFVSINNVLNVHEEMKEEIKNFKT